MAITPITQERFIELAGEVGVPLPLAAAFYGVESNFGQNKDAFVSPIERANSGRMSRDPNKIGYGSMQIIKPTFEGVMPGVNFYEADDETLVKASLMYLKKVVKPDGSYDIQRAKEHYFGSGIDPSFKVGDDGKTYPANDPRGKYAYRPSQHSGRAKQISTYEANVRAGMNSPSAASLSGLARGDGSVGSNSNGGGYAPTQIAATSLAQQAEQEIKFDPEAAQIKKDAAAAAMRDVLESQRTKEMEAQRKVGDTFQVNPYGAFGQAQKMADALMASQNRLQQMIAFGSYQGTEATGIQGALEMFLKKTAADKLIPKYAKETEQLAKAAADYNAVVRGVQANAAVMGTDYKDTIAIENAAQKAGADALAIDLKAADIDIKNMGVQQRNAAALMRQEQFAANQARLRENEESNRRFREKDQQIAELNLKVRQDAEARKAAEGFGSGDEEILNGAIAAINKSANPNYIHTNIPIKVINSTYLKDKGLREEIRRRIQANETGENPGAATGNVSDNFVTAISSATDPAVRTALANLKSEFDKVRIANLDDVANRLAPSKGNKKTSWATLSDRRTGFLKESQIAEAETKASNNAAISVGALPTPDSNFNRNPVNVRPFSDYVQTIGATDLAVTLKNSNINPAALNSDAELITKLAVQTRSGGLAVGQDVLLAQLDNFYKGLARARADEPVIKQTGIKVDKSKYVVMSHNGKPFNLANRAELINYFEAAKKMEETSQKRKQITDSIFQTGIEIGYMPN